MSTYDVSLGAHTRWWKHGFICFIYYNFDFFSVKVSDGDLQRVSSRHLVPNALGWVTITTSPVHICICTEIRERPEVEMSERKDNQRWQKSVSSTRKNSQAEKLGKDWWVRPMQKNTYSYMDTVPPPMDGATDPSGFFFQKFSSKNANFSIKFQKNWAKFRGFHMFRQIFADLNGKFSKFMQISSIPNKFA